MGRLDITDKISAFNARAQSAGWPMRCDAGLSFESTVLREAVAVWREKAGARLWPKRADMTPRAMKAFLTWLAVIDVVYMSGRVRYRARVTGTDLERYYGRAPVGTLLDEIVPEPFYARWSAVWGLALEIEGLVRMTSRVEFRDQEYLHMECFVAPLGEPGQPPDAILQVAQFRSI